MLKRVVGVVAMVCMTVAAFAQNAAVEQVRGRVQSVSPEDTRDLKMIAEERGEVVELTGRPPGARPYRLTLSTGIEHQSNAPLLGNGQHGDWLSLSSLEAGFKLPLAEGIGLDLALRTDVAHYFHFDEISYRGPSATALVDYRPRSSWPRVYAGGQLYRYDLISDGTKITDAGAVLAGVDQSWTFDEGRSGLSAGYQFAIYWASPQSEDRTSHALFAAFTHRFSESLYGQASWVWQYTDFETQPRHDSRNTIGLGLIYALKANISLRLYANYVRNESSNPNTDYENFPVGLGAVFTTQF